VTRLLALLVAIATVAGSATGRLCPPQCAPDPCHGAAASASAAVAVAVSAPCPPAIAATAVLPADEQGRRAPVPPTAAPANGLRLADLLQPHQRGRRLTVPQRRPATISPFPLRI
jgi:hypothetical protein